MGDFFFFCCVSGMYINIGNFVSATAFLLFFVSSKIKSWHRSAGHKLVPEANQGGLLSVLIQSEVLALFG